MAVLSCKPVCFDLFKGHVYIIHYTTGTSHYVRGLSGIVGTRTPDQVSCITAIPGIYLFHFLLVRCASFGCCCAAVGTSRRSFHGRSSCCLLAHPAKTLLKWLLTLWELRWTHGPGWRLKRLRSVARMLRSSSTRCKNTW